MSFTFKGLVTLVGVWVNNTMCSRHDIVEILLMLALNTNQSCYLYVYICLWMYWITQHCDYDVHVLNYALSNKWFEFEFEFVKGIQEIYL
jgi:hypothetical protein